MPTNHSNNASIWNIPNILTLTRVLAIPLLLIVAYGVEFNGDNSQHAQQLRHWALLAIFATAAITDWVDGYLARKLNQVSAFGRFLDPVADKLMVATVFIVLVHWHNSIWMTLAAVIIISREITVSALREWMAEVGSGKSVAVSMLGKLKTTMQMIAIGAFLLNWEPVMPLAYALLATAVALTIWSMLTYLKAAWPHLKQ